MKKNFILLFFLIFITPCFGQHAYFSTNSTTSVGVEVLDMGMSNSYSCSVKKGNEVKKYTPLEVSEYGFDNGRVYKAFDIVINDKKERYFFEQLVDGNIDLYNLKLKGGINKYYILLADSSILKEIKLDKTEIQHFIEPLTEDCNSASQNLKYLKPNKYSLKRYISYLNDCSTYPYPKIQYGLKIGLTATQFYPIDNTSLYGIPNYKTDMSYAAGLFIDIPILSSNLSLTPEIYYKGNHYTTSFVYGQNNFDLVMNYSTLNFPLSLKYTFLRDGNIPYIQFGPMYSRIIKNKSTLYEYELIDNDIFIDINNSPILQKDMGGFSFGGGINADIKKKYVWFGEIRYNYLFNLKPSDKNFNVGELSINTGILF
jgi:hypothetical protein